jgi:uncharacterized protein YecE (DUF72 family)
MSADIQTRRVDRWASKIRCWADRGCDVYVYFDNDVKVRAPFDAINLAARSSLVRAYASRFVTCNRAAALILAWVFLIPPSGA